MKNRKLIVFAFCAVISVMGLKAQKSELLNNSDNKKIVKAEHKISKGDLVVKKKEKFTAQIEALENSDKGIRTRKIERLETKANKEVIKSSSYYKDGYAKKYKTYKNVVSRGIKNESLSSEAARAKENANTAYKNGRKWRRKSASESDVNKAVDYLLKANGSESDAIASLEKILITADVAQEVVLFQEEQKQDSIVELQDTTSLIVLEPGELLLPQDSMVSVMDSALIAEVVDTTSLMVKTELVLPIEMGDSLMVEKEVAKELVLYFSIQFLAEKQPVSQDRIKTLYDGPFEVVMHEAQGWYRYSFGKFESLDEAKEMMAKSGIKGYVVAYHHEERISTREALELVSAKQMN